MKPTCCRWMPELCSLKCDLSCPLKPTWRCTSQLCMQWLRSHALPSCMSELTLQCARQCCPACRLVPEFLEHGMSNPALAAVTVQNLPAPNKNTLQLLLETFHRLNGNAVSLCYRDLPRCTTVAPTQLSLCIACQLFLAPPRASPWGRCLSNAGACATWCLAVQECPDKPTSQLDTFSHHCCRLTTRWMPTRLPQSWRHA